MTITIGSAAIDAVYAAGGIQAEAVYLGTTLVWQATKQSYSYTFSGTTKPPEIIDVALNSGAGIPTTVSGGVIREPNSATSNNTYYTAAIWGVQMGTNYYSSSVKNGNLNATNRYIGAGMSNADGSVVVFCRVPAQAGYAANIMTAIGGVITSQASQNVSVGSSQVIDLIPTISGGVYTYTLYVNGASKFSWTDSSGVIGAPGKYPCGIFGHIYSSGQYGSPGISAYATADI